jgi:N-acylglucosamine-6-phosphate 2-epimerase
MRAIDSLQKLAGGLIVSSQASGSEPLNTPEILTALAESALSGGAIGIRMAQVDNLKFFRKKHPLVPLIGLTKPEPIPTDAASLVYITPTFEAVASIAPYCDIVALDATQRPRPHEETLGSIVRHARQHFPHTLLMADIATLEDGIQAAKLGFDCIGTTLSGYTTETQNLTSSGPDFSLLGNLLSKIDIPVILEGRVWEPDHVGRAFRTGAFAVVVGSAVTRPYEITKRFVQAISS